MNKKKALTLKKGNEELLSCGGNALIGQTLCRHVQATLPENFQIRRRDAICDSDILMAMIGLLANGRSDFTDVDLYRGDCVFLHSFGIERLPSEPTLRQRLDQYAPDCTHAALRKLNQSLLKARPLGTVQVQGDDFIPVDIDVSPLDNSGSNKQGIGFTYKNHDGFAPIFAYIGTEGYMLDHELRTGSQHCQQDTPAFIKSCIKQIQTLQLGKPCLIRMDSGNDAEEIFAHLKDHAFIIRRNMRREKPEQWLALARRVGVGALKLDTREGKNVYTGFTDHLCPGGVKSTTGPVFIAFEVIERLYDPEGNRLLIAEIEVNIFWTNLTCDASKVIRLFYHAHGTSEQFHSELKSDMGVEQLPSGKFCVNQLVLLCAMVSFNALRTIGQEVIQRAHLAPIKIQVSRWRLKTVLQNIIHCPVRVIRHARSIGLHFGRRCPWFTLIENMSQA